jgi:hypothetical protein
VSSKNHLTDAAQKTCHEMLRRYQWLKNSGCDVLSAQDGIPPHSARFRRCGGSGGVLIGFAVKFFPFGRNRRFAFENLSMRDGPAIRKVHTTAQSDTMARIKTRSRFRATNSKAGFARAGYAQHANRAPFMEMFHGFARRTFVERLGGIGLCGLRRSSLPSGWQVDCTFAANRFL